MAGFQKTENGNFLIKIHTLTLYDHLQANANLYALHCRLHRRLNYLICSCHLSVILAMKIDIIASNTYYHPCDEEEFHEHLQPNDGVAATEVLICASFNTQCFHYSHHQYKKSEISKDDKNDWN